MAVVTECPEADTPTYHVVNLNNMFSPPLENPPPKNLLSSCKSCLSKDNLILQLEKKDPTAWK